jgi:hypothetical protein
MHQLVTKVMLLNVSTGNGEVQLQVQTFKGHSMCSQPLMLVFAVESEQSPACQSSMGHTYNCFIGCQPWVTVSNGDACLC